MQEKADMRLVRVMIEVIDTIRIDQRSPPLHAVDDVIFRQQKLGEESAVLPGGPGDQRNLF
jgi:hypothetical protein